ncbi:hypothetical protein [Leucothrix pacifica]|uniref:hypothetical protein n=1 Tax=Leucothrix pacifica TaxID=1247513 RepID=UPI0011B1FE3C|nr:hypothetical protein [Leucothrix pacifica]
MRFTDTLCCSQESSCNNRHRDASAPAIFPQLIEFIAENCQKQIAKDATACIACPRYENVRAMR